MNKLTIKKLQNVLVRKAEDEGISVERYCNPNTDYIILPKGCILPVSWSGSQYDFVVYADKYEAKGDTIHGDKVIRLVPWLIKNGVITKKFELKRV